MANELTPLQNLKHTAGVVKGEIASYLEQGDINLPQRYSAGNSLKQFVLMVQGNEKLMACTQSSLAKCMLDMVILGLNPSKKQCYAVPFGNEATLMVSYEGKVAIAKRVDPGIEEVVAAAIHRGEEFEFEASPLGGAKILKHSRSLESMEIKDPNNDVVGAYATIIYNDGREPKSMVMPFSEIKKRWSKSPAKPFDNNGKLKTDSVHYQFTDRMAERTLISAICTPIIASSSDAGLFEAVAKSVSVDAAKAEADQEAEEKMCSEEIIDVDFDEFDGDLDDVATATTEENEEIFSE